MSCFGSLLIDPCIFINFITKFLHLINLQESFLTNYLEVKIKAPHYPNMLCAPTQLIDENLSKENLVGGIPRRVLYVVR